MRTMQETWQFRGTWFIHRAKNVANIVLPFLVDPIQIMKAMKFWMTEV